MESGPPDVSVIAKAVRILETFTIREPSLTLTELSERTGMSPSTTLRRAQDLLRHGLLERDPEGRFSIGAKVRAIAAAAPTGGRLTEVALPVMQDISAMTRYDVALTVIQNRQGLLAERLYSRGGPPLNYQSGELMPLHATGGGLVLLAFSSEEFREEILSGELEKVTPHTEIDPEHLRRTLRRVRRQGYVLSERGSNERTSSIGAPVFGPSGNIVAALSVIFGHEMEHPPSLVDLARVGALTITRHLGGHNPPGLRR